MTDAGLGAFAQMLEDDVADGRGDDGDGEILDGEDVVEGDGEGLASAVGAVEFAHEEVGIEEEDDERDLDDRSADVGERRDVPGVLGHGGGTSFSEARWPAGCCLSGWDERGSKSILCH